MDREQFYKKIQEADNNSLRVGAANRIVQLLEKQRYSNNENSVKRWIWELCQNAKDVCNETGKVKICIDFDRTNSRVIFKHNGKAFSMDNVMSLINQSSSKDRYDGTERKSGKFGTGFITTHLLSEIVEVSGILETESNKYSTFQITLDRTGHEKHEIMAALERSVEQLQDCQPIAGNAITVDSYNTVFIYKLEEESIDVAEQGIDNLKISAPYVLSMLRDIEEINLESTREKYKYGGEVSCGLDGASAHKIIYESGEGTKEIYVLNLTEDNTTISIALEKREHENYILPYSIQQSKLFCDFPLIGTEDFPFPVLVCSQDFNPTEPRDGIYMTCKIKAKVDEKVEQNREILERACLLYEKLLRYAAEKRWGGIYNITKVNSYEKKEWYDEEWLEGIVNNCKECILQSPIIRTANDTMMELKKNDEEQVYIISSVKEDMREEIWKLLYYIMPEKIPHWDDVHNWYNSLWKGCNKYNFKSLTEQIQAYGNVECLQENLTGKDWKSWLLEYYNIIEKSEKVRRYINTEHINIIPNQNGTLCKVASLNYDINILDEYKEILKCLGHDCREWLLDTSFAVREWFQFDEYDNEKILTLIEYYLASADREQKNEIFCRMAYMYRKQYDGLQVQRNICQYSEKILKMNMKMKEVSVISEKILQESLKHMITCVADRISECRCIQGLAYHLEMNEEETEKLLANFIEFVVNQGFDNLINKTTRPILPNQNGMFRVKDDIFIDCEMDEVLKELVVATGYDVKAELLAREVYLMLPESRWKKDSDISQIIAQYVNMNRTSKEEAVRKNFKRLLIWMCDHEDKAIEIFPELYRNKHYLYDDDEIAQNIRQAETINHIMEKFEISSMEKLEEIIRSSNRQYNDDNSERVELTEEILLQLGIDSEVELEEAFSNDEFSSRYIRKSKHDAATYEYVKSILERSKNNILSYLDKREEYDISNVQAIANTIFIIKKNGKEIYLLARPSDGGEIRIFYKTEMDLLDYTMDWELWVEDGKSEPQKITFGKIIKLTGLNRIPLKGM